jgi:hypothetical protein
VSILLPQRAGFDIVSASLGLKVSLESSGKQARVVSPDPVLVEFNRLVGVDTIVDTFGSRNLIITFPNQTEHVDKVSYNLEKGELQLVITPKPEAPELDHQKLRFISGVGRTDLIITMGVRKLTDLGPVYDQVKDHLSTTAVVSFSHRTPKESFTSNEVHDYEASSLSELTTHIIDLLDLKFEQDAASNLLAGIEKATGNFQHPTVTVNTFEAAVILMHKGAKRHFEISASQFPPGSIPSSPGDQKQQTTVPSPVSATDKPQPSVQVGYGTDGTNLGQNKNLQKPPADWYEPKIFKGPMLP